jgi:hypothetical protein
MTTISAKAVADSISPEGKRLLTFQLRYPLFIHAEDKTHRALIEHGKYYEYEDHTALMYDSNLSRNARSSRAVPIQKMIDEVMNDPVIPIHWGAAQKGMQADNECHNLVDRSWRDDCSPGEDTAKDAWLTARDYAVGSARAFMEAGYAKQVVNRLLGPFLHIDTLVTGTEFNNFFSLRDHADAEPHIRVLAGEMKKAMAASTPTPLQPGEWHVPYIERGSDDALAIVDYARQNEMQPYDVAARVSAARCARISYKPFDGKASIHDEIVRFNHLSKSTPPHGSPMEHQATPDIVVSRYVTKNTPIYQSPELHGNLVGWCQFRKTLPGEYVAG